MKQCNHYTIVTGAAGFIGSQLCDILLEQGERVLGIDNFVRGTQANLEMANRHPNFSFAELDIENEGQFSDAVASTAGQPQRIWHMAANSDIAAGVADPDIDLRDTFQTTYSAAKICTRFDIREFCFASTSAIYGDHSGVSVPEHAGPLFPISNYGAMKLAAEAIISALAESQLTTSWIFRFPNVVGARATHGVIYDFLDKLDATPGELQVLGNGAQCKPYLLAQDLISAMLFIVENTHERRNCFNIGPADDGVTVREIAEIVVAQRAPSARIVYGEGDRGWIGDVPRFSYCIDKLANLGWSPRRSSRMAIEEAVALQIAERNRQPA